MATTREFTSEPPPQQSDNGKTGHALPGERQNVLDSQGEAQDPNIVDWDSPDDPANPQNWCAAHENRAILLLPVTQRSKR